jgi:thiol-disulfide isomerase/thioredoxin
MPIQKIAVLVFGLALASVLVFAGCGSTEPASETETTTAVEDASPATTDVDDATETDATSDVVDESEAEQETVETSSTTPAKFGVGSLAPEIQSDPGGWINSTPLSIAGSRGQVVLIDFWTYTCINCIRTLPYLKAWHDTYADDGLRIIGVHTPEFEFEKIRENVEEAMVEFGLKYPVVQDNDFLTWRAFENRYWPAKYLIDKDGVIRYTHFGEGAYDRTEEMIKELLSETGSDPGVELVSPDAPEQDPSAYPADRMKGLTRELYAGASRSYSALYNGDAPYIMQEAFYQGAEQVVDYADPGEHSNHFLYLHGLWHNGLESVLHARETEEFEDYILVKFYAREVNVVMSAEELVEPYDVRLTLDGAPVNQEAAGDDIMYDKDGNSYVRVDSSRMYNIVDSNVFSGRELRLSSNSGDFELYAFTFGAYQPSAGS